MNENSISFQFSARFYDNGVAVSEAVEVLFALHGQGQLGKFFIKKFEILASKKILVIVPEGLSRYYLDGSGGRVGATWMTSENRLVDIENYLSYLNQIYRDTVNKD